MSFTGAGAHPAIGLASQKLLRTDDEAQVSFQSVGLSPRQQELDRRWGYYKCEQYSARSVSWDGSRVVGRTEHDSIALAGYVPPGFYIANSETLPIQFRKPSTPYHLCKVIVDRFTGLLFGQKRHPKIEVKGDPQTEDFVNAIAEVGRLWPAFGQARTFGGGSGTAAIGFKVINGRPQFEVFDPRWCVPDFIDRANLVLSALEYKHTFKQEVRDEEGDLVEVDFWYRRVIDTNQDVIFKPVIADPRIKPVWEPDVVVQHGLGFCPVVWIQNEPCATEVDGEPDCLGVYELSEAIDRLNAQGEKGILANCDPTAVVTTDAVMGEVRKGSTNALKLPAGGTAVYMEMTGTGVIQAREQAKLYKEMALEIAQCVLENPSAGTAKTATEVERSYAAMLARADTFREQYGEMGVKKLINMVLVASVRLQQPRNINGKITRFAIILPTKADGTEYRLGKGPYQASLNWPPYFEPSMDDAAKAVTTAGLAKQSGLVDQTHATKFIAPFFQIEDPTQLADDMRRAEGATQDSIESDILKGAEPDEPTAEPASKEQDTAFNGAQVTALADLIKAVAAGELPVSAAREIILVAFANVSPDAADRMLSGLKGAVPKAAAIARAAPAAAPPTPPVPGAEGQ